MMLKGPILTHTKDSENAQSTPQGRSLPGNMEILRRRFYRCPLPRSSVTNPVAVMAAPFANPLYNKITFRRLQEEGKVCTIGPCVDPAKYTVVGMFEGSDTVWRVCREHAEELLRMGLSEL